MCGIVGAIASRNVAEILLEGLRRLEYRGYDSAGVALITDEGIVERERALGKVAALTDNLKKISYRWKSGYCTYPLGYPWKTQCHERSSSYVR
jgi:glucosamine--fructose-6-phosphate aminotransferase (isomerizing)